MAQQWYCRISGKQYGPLSGQQLKKLATTGKLKPEDGVRRESDEKWAPAGKVKGLFSEKPAAQATAEKPQAKSAAASTSSAKPASKPAKSAAKPASGGKKKPSEQRIPTAKPIPAKKPEPEPVEDDDDDDQYMLAPVESATPAKSATKESELAPKSPTPARPAPAAGAPAEAAYQPQGSQLSDDVLLYARVVTTAGIGAVFGFATVCLAKVPILPILGGVLGLVFGFRALVQSKFDRNAIGLSLVALVLSLIGFFWGLRSTLSDPQPVTTLQEVFGIIQPDPGAGTLQAGRDIGEIGGLGVMVAETYVGTVPGVDDSKYYVILSVRLVNESNAPINYKSWSMAANGAVLVDGTGKQYGIVTDTRVKGQLSSLTLKAGDRRKDVLVFENPRGFHDTLELTLSGRAVDAEGLLTFTIPHTVDNFRYSPLSLPKAKKSKKRSKTTVEVGAE